MLSERCPMFRLMVLSLLLPVVLSAALEVPLTVEESAGFTRRAELASGGVILPRGMVADPGSLRVLGISGQPLPAQFETLASWPDGSIKWVLVSFPADCPAGATASFTLTDRALPAPSCPPLRVTEEPGRVVIETGVLRSVLDREHFDLFGELWLDHDRDGAFSAAERVTPAGEPAAGLRLLQDRGRLFDGRQGQVDSLAVESAGPLKAVVMVKGHLGDQDGPGALSYTARLHFYAGTGFTRVFFTLENRQPTVPLPGAHWVLGQPGAELFEDFSLATRLAFDGPITVSVGDGPRELLDRMVVRSRGGIYQESSGGENWFHRAHMNREGDLPLTFRGAKIFLDGKEPHTALRPDAWLHACDRRFGLAVAVRHFWQNFPKALTADSDGTVRVGLWPEEFPDLHELQGGEIKTHELAFFFHTGPQGSTRDENRIATTMGAFHHPLAVRAPAEWYLASGFFDDAAPYDPQRFPDYERYMQGALQGKAANLAADFETNDEYGWRDFGDTWANNEIDQTRGPHHGRLASSHFNLEYDFGYGMLFQGLRTLGAAPS